MLTFCIPIFLFLFSINNVFAQYDPTTSNIAVWLSGAAYCGRNQYAQMLLGGDASNVEVKKTIYDPKTDLQGFVAVSPLTRQIYVVFRGSSSALNWMDDFEVNRVPYSTFSECACTVHNGFYRSTLAVRNMTLDYIKRLNLEYPLYSIVSTGHSYGAAVAQLMALELVKQGYGVSVFNFGQPRVGDATYSSFVSTQLKQNWRFTHAQDIVPHLPPISGFGYAHSCREVFENETHDIRVCSAIQCEDPTCSAQFPLYKTNADDHMLYLNHYLSCETSTVSV